MKPGIGIKKKKKNYIKEKNIHILKNDYSHMFSYIKHIYISRI